MEPGDEAEHALLVFEQGLAAVDMRVQRIAGDAGMEFGDWFSVEPQSLSAAYGKSAPLRFIDICASGGCAAANTRTRAAVCACSMPRAVRCTSTWGLSLHNRNRL
jgi:hypothetical protein